MTAKLLHVRSTGSNSPMFNGAMVGYRMKDTALYPNAGNTTTWPDTPYSDFNLISLSGYDDISHNTGMRILMNEGKKRYKSFEYGFTSGLYPNYNQIYGFQFEYVMGAEAANRYHNAWIERYGVLMENGTFWAADPPTKDDYTLTGSPRTVTCTGSSFESALRNTSIKCFRVNISTEGGAYKTQRALDVRKFKFLFRNGYSSSHKIVLPPNRPYAERNARTKLTR
ncbi:MAG: hypothetical protein VW270_15560 [Candidatus Poseidoniales archaeon]